MRTKRSILKVMKVVVLYRPNSETSRSVEDFVKELEKEHKARVDLVSLDTRDGSSTASLYDVMQNPAILVLANDGQLVKDWQGKSLPLKNEVSYYTHL
jgi:thioredoxin-like negative regulator of GroEL